MRKSCKLIVFVFYFLPIFLAVNAIADGGGKLILGYSYLDEMGNQSVSFSSFNKYEGISLSLEEFRYRSDNGLQLDADLRRITLNNRNIRLNLRQSRLFGISLTNNQYRRVYNFDGSDFTRRHRTGASAWIAPLKYIKISANGYFSGESGRTNNYFDPGIIPSPVPIDFENHTFDIGIRYNRQNRMLLAEYFGGKFANKNDGNRDQTRNRIKFVGLLALPKIDWVILSGGFLHFENKYDATDFKIRSNRSWGGLLLNLPENFSVNYHFIFDRTNSDSDFASTDNLSHALYISHIFQSKGGLTAGYQNDINDDFSDEVNSDSYYLSGWLRPNNRLEFKGEYGSRIEKMTGGYRLLGHEDRQKFAVSGKYQIPDIGAISLGFDGHRRNNEIIGSEYDFDRLSASGSLHTPIGVISGGYSYSLGEYENDEQTFDFSNSSFSADLSLKEYHGLVLSFGAVYYRSLRDIDTESFNLKFKALYGFSPNYGVEIVYDVDNFDDFMERDQYYTSNIIEINLIKNILF